MTSTCSTSPLESATGGLSAATGTVMPDWSVGTDMLLAGGERKGAVCTGNPRRGAIYASQDSGLLWFLPRRFKANPLLYPFAGDQLIDTAFKPHSWGRHDRGLGVENCLRHIQANEMR